MAAALRYRLDVEWLNGGRLRASLQAADLRDAIEQANRTIDTLSRVRGLAIGVSLSPVVPVARVERCGRS